MHAGARLLLRKQSFQSCIRHLNYFFRIQSADASYHLTDSRLLKTGCNPSVAKCFSSVSNPSNFSHAHSPEQASQKHLDVHEGSWSQPEYRPPSWSSVGSELEGGKDRSNLSRALSFQPAERTAASFQIEQPDLLRDSGDARSWQQHEVVSGATLPGSDGLRAYATVRAATRSFVPVNTGSASSSSSSSTHAIDAGENSILHSANSQQAEFDFPAKAYYIGATAFRHLIPDSMKSLSCPTPTLLHSTILLKLPHHGARKIWHIGWFAVAHAIGISDTLCGMSKHSPTYPQNAEFHR